MKIPTADRRFEMKVVVKLKTITKLRVQRKTMLREAVMKVADVDALEPIVLHFGGPIETVTDLNTRMIRTCKQPNELAKRKRRLVVVNRD